jgi:hypothetical protein
LKEKDVEAEKEGRTNNVIKILKWLPMNVAAAAAQSENNAAVGCRAKLLRNFVPIDDYTSVLSSTQP